MKRILGWAWLICALPAAAASAVDIDLLKISDFKLANGMQFIVMERHQAPVVSFFTYADVGSAQEPKGKTGLAHLFEHLAFKGTENLGTTDYAREKPLLAAVDQAFEAWRAEKLKGRLADPEKLKKLAQTLQEAQQAAAALVVPNQFGRIVEQAGGRDLNAATSRDATVYQLSLPSNETELWFFLESDRFFQPVLREFHKEREVVMQERRMRTESDPVGRMIEEILAVAYKAHPYGQPTIGHMSDLQFLSRPDAEVFFQTYYGPNNLVAVIVGDVQPMEIKKLAEKYFGRIPARPKPEPLHAIEPPQTGERRVRLRLQSQPVLAVAFHRPDINDPDDAVYDVLASLLSEGRSSRLYRSLVRDKRVAVEASGFSGFPGEKYPGLFLFYIVAAPGHSNAVLESALEEELGRLQGELVASAELEGVKRRSRANMLRQLDDNMEIAAMLARMQALTGTWRNAFRQLDRIARVTPEDVRRVARKTFTFDNRTVATIEPAEEPARR